MPATRGGSIYRVVVPERVLALCEEHARKVQDCRPSSLEELRGRFLEPFPGQRSLIPRRAQVYAASSSVEDRRRRGRRTTD
ncbi:MAG TPA: hypothetical protein VK524_20505 [Polyangiaceae bacterium]|nr:hypothetical protein [Polyangiaceae bacterium]